MLRFFSYNHVVTYVALFVITVALRLPSFHSQYFQEDEAYYLTAAEKIVDGGVQYVDTWDNKPPVLTWFYAVFVAILGDFAIIGIRIFTIIYVFLTALLLSQFVVDNKLMERFSLLPGFMYVVMVSVPWYSQELNGEILMNLPIVVCMINLLKLDESTRENQRRMFWVGALMGLCFMIKYQAVLVLLGLLVAYFTLVTARVAETFSLAGGFALVLFLFLSVIYLNGALAAFWDVGVLYNLDYIFTGKNPGETVDVLFNLGQYLKLWGAFTLVAFISIVNFRLSYFKNAIRLRKIEVLILFWTISTALTIVLGGGRLYLHYFYLLVPVLCVYAVTFFEMKVKGWLRSLSFLLVMAMPVYTYGVYALVAFPQSFSFMETYIQPGGWIHGMRAQLNEPHPLSKYIEPSKVHNGILVLAYEPTVYARLNLPCATRYTNFSVAFYKWSVYKPLHGMSLVSRTETQADIFKAFKEELPEYIIDPAGLFPMLRDQIPVLFAPYKTRQVNDGERSYKLYFLS